MKGVILCAGKGERLRPMTDLLAKPMIQIKGKPILQYTLELLVKYGIRDIAVNTSHLSHTIREYFGNGDRFGVKINYSYEPELLGTAGALNSFRASLDKPFVVIYGDSITDIDLNEFLRAHNSSDRIATIAIRKNQEKYQDIKGIVCCEKDLRLKRFIETLSDEERNRMNCSGLAENEFLNSGIYILNPDILSFIPSGFSDFSSDIFPRVIDAGQNVYGFLIDKFNFREIGKMEKYLNAKREIESGQLRLNI